MRYKARTTQPRRPSAPRSATPRPVSGHGTVTLFVESGAVAVSLTVDLDVGHGATPGASFLKVDVGADGAGEIELHVAHLPDLLKALDAAVVMAKASGAA